MEAEPGAPVQVRLEQREREASCASVEDDGAQREPAQAQPRRDRAPAAGVRARARRARRARRRAPTEHGASPSETSVTTTRLGPPASASSTAWRAGSALQRVGEPARDRDEQRDDGRATRGSALSSHLQRKRRRHDAAAIWNWRKSRQVPATGSSTPTCSLPGPAGRPVTFAPPKTLVQPGVERPADVRVEVVERSLAEEDRVGERAVPGCEAHRLAARVGDRRGQVRRLDRVDLLRRARASPCSRRRADVRRTAAAAAAGTRPRRAGPGVQLEVARSAFRARVGVDQHPVRAGGGEVDRL